MLHTTHRKPIVFMNTTIFVRTLLISGCFISSGVIASETDEDIQDMSDPLSVYTQIGAGMTNHGLNIKVGRSYDTGNADTAGMNVVEIKGLMGDAIGISDHAKGNNADSLRFRNFVANTSNGRGTQIDVQYDLNNESGSASYSLIQALPKLGRLSVFPLMGAGVSFQNTTLDDGQKVGGYAIPGTFGVVGTYSKLQLTDNLWFNYNPMWFTTLSGSEQYVTSSLDNSNHLLQHEVALGYRITPRFNVRYFSNWTENQAFKGGSHRIEFNYQL